MSKESPPKPNAPLRRRKSDQKPSGNAMGSALGILRRVSQSTVVEKLNLHKPLEKAIYHGSKTGFSVIAGANSRFNKSGPANKVSPKQTNRSPQNGHSLATPASGTLFDLSLNEEQTMVQESLQRLGDEVLRPAAESADHAGQTDKKLLQQVHDLGLMHMIIPEDFGGAASERSPVTQTLITEALGKADMGIALAALAPVAVVNALVNWGSSTQQQRYLPAFTGEEFVPAALAISESQPLFAPYQLQCTAKRTAQGFVLNGSKTLVAHAQSAELFLVAAELPGHGPQLFIVEPNNDGVTTAATGSMGNAAAALGQLNLDNVSVSIDAWLGENQANGFSYDELISLSKIAWAALVCGTSQAALDYVIPYVKERHAFGEPIANRQSVAFMVANIGIELEGLRLMTWRAASRAEQGLSFRQQAYLAHLQATEKGMQIGSDAVQLLGGHGFTCEHPVERWYRQLRAPACSYGLVLV